MKSSARLLFLVAASCALSLHEGRVCAQTPGDATSFTPSRDDWGEYGLIQAPVARTGTDGDFAFTYSHVHPYDRYNLFFTPLPWLEGGFRYTDITNRLYSDVPSFSGNQTYKDKSFDVKIRLAQESASFPELSVGFRDIAGTGLFSGEYLVMSRRYYNFDFSAGIGWGYLGQSRYHFPNPFGILGKSFKTRPQSQQTGGFTFDYFHGPNAAVFGGFEYHTPIKHLRLKLELDPNDYKNEPLGNAFQQRLPVNAAVVYRPYSFMEVSAGFERGTTLMLRVTLRANFNSIGLFHDKSEPPQLVPRPMPPEPAGRPVSDTDLPTVADAETTSQLPLEAQQPDDSRPSADMLRIAPRAEPVRCEPLKIVSTQSEPPPPALKSAMSVYDQAAIAKKVFGDLKKIGFSGQYFAISGNHAYLSFSQNKYHTLTIALGRAARIVAQDAPPNVELITLDALEDGLVAVSVTIYRRDLENAVAEMGSTEEIWEKAKLAGGDPAMPTNGVFNRDLFPNFDWSINPAMRQQLGGPNDFFIYQFYVAANGEIGMAPGLTMDGTLGANLFNNLNQLTLQSNSVLPHVRSDIAKYLKEGKTGIFRWQSDYLFNIAPNWYGRVSGGLLEEMFAGADGEILYRPYQQRWAIGLDMNYLRQREYHELFAFLPYHVETGQLTFYYKLPFYNLEAALHIGRYLAGDKGGTIELSREFAGGVRVGVFATKTNVSAAEFGEGSFDKGFFISIPLDLMFGNPSRTVAAYTYRPLTRDGGQYVDIAKPLYQMTDGYDPDELSKMWPQLLK